MIHTRRYNNNKTREYPKIYIFLKISIKFYEMYSMSRFVEILSCKTPTK